MTLPKILIIGLGFACARDAVSQATNPVQENQPSISISLRAEHDTVKAGAPIVLKETLTNQSVHEFTYGKDRYHPGCPFDVFDESGKFAADKRLGYRHGRLDILQLARTLSPEELAKSGFLTGSLVWISLKPGEAWVETCDVSGFYDMTKPGVYKISSEFHDPESGTAVKSNVIEVTVTKPE